MTSVVEILAGSVLAIVLIALIQRYRPSANVIILSASLFVAALIYVGFAVVGVTLGNADSSWLIFEVGGVFFYSVFAYLGFRASPWYLAAGWGLHVMWDATFHTDAAFVPAVYPGICIGFDVVVAIFAVYLSARRSEN